MNCGVEDSWESLGPQGDTTSPSSRRSVLGVHWKDWCWSWNSKTLATWCEELTHLKRLWCWERLRAGGEVDDRGCDGWMASPTQWTWVWVDSGSWWWIGRPGVLQFMGSQRVSNLQINFYNNGDLLWLQFWFALPHYNATKYRSFSIWQYIVEVLLIFMWSRFPGVGLLTQRYIYTLHFNICFCIALQKCE